MEDGRAQLVACEVRVGAGVRVEELSDGDGSGSVKIGQPFEVDLKPAKDLEKFRGEEAVYTDND